MKNNFFKRLKKFFTGRNIIQDHADEVIKVLETVKRIAESPAAGIAVSLTKTPLDNIILAKLQQLIPKTLLLVKTVDRFNDCLLNYKGSEAVDCIVMNLAALPKSERNAYYHELAKDLLRSMLEDLGVKPPSDELAAIVEGAYQAYKNNKVFEN